MGGLDTQIADMNRPLVYSPAAPDYDYEAAKKAGIFPDARGHMPDTYKLPNHITFSTDSVYHSEKTPGGKWIADKNGKWSYIPSAYVLSQHPADELRKYFEMYELDATLVIPGE